MRFIIIALFFFSSTTFSQEKTVDVYFKNTPASEVLKIIETHFGITISYADESLEGKFFSLKSKEATLEELLFELSTKLNLKFRFIKNDYIVLTKQEKKQDPIYKLSEVVLKSYLTRGIAKNKNGTFIINPKKLDILPGITEADVLESIQELPGVISPDETATGLNVRGGDVDQNHILWDDITIYHTGHFFGMISPFNPNITKKVTFHNKGFNPRFGDRISSVIDISTNNKIEEKANYGFGFNGISADAFFEIPVIKDKMSIIASFRRSYKDIYETQTVQKLENKVFQNTTIQDNSFSEETFHFKDYTIKWNYILNQNNRFSFSLIHIDNFLEHTFKDLETEKDYIDLLDIRNNGYSFNWEKNWNKKITQKSKFSLSEYELEYHFIEKTNEVENSKFEKENKIMDSNFTTEFLIDLNNNDSFNLGYQFFSKKVNYVFDETKVLEYILDQDNSKINSHSFFLNYANRSNRFINFDVGVRSTYHDNINKFRLEPRVFITKEINDHLILQFSGEIKNQIISQINETILSDLSLENKLWKLANNEGTPIIKANQFSAGFLYQNNGWVFDVDTYTKKTSGINALTLGFFSEKPQRFNIGKEKILGTDVYLKKTFKKISTWVSYSFIDIQKQFEEINEGEFFPSSNQIKHALSTSIAYKTDNFQVSLGYKWHTGKPFTKLISDGSDDQLNYEEINTERLPNYQRLDLSTLYNFSFSKKLNISGKIGLSLRNILNQTNLISKEYIGNNIVNDPIIVRDHYSIGMVPNMVFRVNW